ncbi:sensor histidine kinase [Marinitenerispora sediminis]|uniref:histidine kinase n=1 Tax=Marinitenerispora sediminis TaxID=1931232 RepID=A0A368TF46_9ACTN|nr:histidine kinase [Marinitenerispora sediminis]RCV55283.1 sensor histidine kinase [Marinitenerispora sediminis]RCV61612.1 sensor histidine kinase [Marinitenerispora sediminis]RCV62657.1 sensor histidine kinase [Marinitenerispora sediminis]
MLYLAIGSLLVALASVGELVRRAVRDRRRERLPAAAATCAALHTAALAAPALRQGLGRDSARRAVRHLRSLLGTPAAAIVGTDGLLAWSGSGTAHSAAAVRLAHPVLAGGRPHVHDRLDCGDPACGLRAAVAAPLVVDGQTVGALLAFAASETALPARAASDVAGWVSGQLELAELDRYRVRLADAEIRALRLQISPHFVYNCLTTIASFVRTDPERARGLLLDFADFARYSFRSSRNLTTLDEELRSIDRYLALERARFGERLRLTVRVAPEVLPVKVPFLCLQPLVENAIRHGIEGKPGVGQVSVTARDAGAEAHISVEDDGIGMDPDRLRAILSGQADGSSGIGLANVDERLRNMFGDAYGLVIETGPGAGTKVNLRFPKFLPKGE